MPKQKSKIKDPFAKREAKKYDNPIPSREYIIDFLYKKKKPLSIKELIQDLGLVESDERVAIKRRLRAMLRDEQLQKWGKNNYWPADQVDYIKGKLIFDRGQLWLQPEKGGSHLKVKSSIEKVYPGDIVSVALPSIHGEIDEDVVAEVVEVIKRRDRFVVGRFVEENGFSYVVSYEVNIRQDILIPGGKTGKAKDSDLVLVKMDETRDSGWQDPIGSVVKVIGTLEDAKSVISSSLHNHLIPYEWPEAVNKQLEKLPKTITKTHLKTRLDLRDKPFVTIDGEDARDFDDAVYCERRKSGGFTLYVAIADVSHYIKPGSALDKESNLRGTSVYFPGTVIPMLPELLSNGLCSLRPNEDKLVLVCEMMISSKGKVTRFQFHEAIISSWARLTYNEVEKFLYDSSTTIPRKYGDEVVENINNLFSLFQSLREQRDIRGAIDFDTVETKIVFGKKGKIKKIEPVFRGDSHKIIEECMLCANVSAAKYLLKHRKSAMFRNHQGPTDEKLKDLEAFLAGMGIKLVNRKKDVETKDYSNLLKETADKPQSQVIQKMVLRSMSQACYESSNQGHFGLSYKAYTHFTSPIRRYPDLIVHRMIKDALHGDDKLCKKLKLDDIAEHSSYTERRADDSTRDVVKIFKCQYMMRHLGKEYDGIVSGVTQFGIFVELKGVYVDGLVHVSSMNRDYYHYNPIANELVGEMTNQVYGIGTEVKVMVSKVDVDKKRIDLDLVTEGKDIKIKPDRKRLKSKLHKERERKKSIRDSKGQGKKVKVAGKKKEKKRIKGKRK